MSMLLLVRNFVPAHEQIERGDWNVAEVARSSFDLEGKVIGTVGAGVSDCVTRVETGDGQLTTDVRSVSASVFSSD
jgi:hypothetical protein